MALETRSFASIVTFASPFDLKIVRRDSMFRANCSGRMKFIKDYRAMSSGAMVNSNSNGSPLALEGCFAGESQLITTSTEPGT